MPGAGPGTGGSGVCKYGRALRTNRKPGKDVTEPESETASRRGRTWGYRGAGRKAGRSPQSAPGAGPAADSLGGGQPPVWVSDGALLPSAPLRKFGRSGGSGGRF